MKTFLAAFGFLIAIGVSTAFPAENQAEGFYFGVDAGGNLMSRVRHPHTPLTLSMEPGARFDAQIGYNFWKDNVMDWGAELEAGFAYNGINHGTLAGVPTRASGYLMQIPVLVNTVFRFFPQSHWNPYLGVGGGGERSILSFSFFDTAEEIEPAAQISGGLVYSADDLLSVGVGYKCMIVFPDQLRHVVNHSAVVVLGVNF